MAITTSIPRTQFNFANFRSMHEAMHQMRRYFVKLTMSECPTEDVDVAHLLRLCYFGRSTHKYKFTKRKLEIKKVQL